MFDPERRPMKDDGIIDLPLNDVIDEDPLVIVDSRVNEISTESSITADDEEKQKRLQNYQPPKDFDKKKAA